MSKKAKSILQIIIGLICIFIGNFATSYFFDTKSIRVTMYILSVAGIILLSRGINHFYINRMKEKSPDIYRNIVIEETDERTVQIKQMAKSKTYDITIFLMLLVMFSLCIIGESLLTALLFGVVLALSGALYLYFRFKYEDHM